MNGSEFSLSTIFYYIASGAISEGTKKNIAVANERSSLQRYSLSTLQFFYDFAKFKIRTFEITIYWERFKMTKGKYLRIQSSENIVRHSNATKKFIRLSWIVIDLASTKTCLILFKNYFHYFFRYHYIFFQAGMLMSAQQDGKEPEMFSAGTKKVFSDC